MALEAAQSGPTDDEIEAARTAMRQAEAHRARLAERTAAADSTADFGSLIADTLVVNLFGAPFPENEIPFVPRPGVRGPLDAMLLAVQAVGVVFAWPVTSKVT